MKHSELPKEYRPKTLPYEVKLDPKKRKHTLYFIIWKQADGMYFGVPYDVKNAKFVHGGRTNVMELLKVCPRSTWSTYIIQIRKDGRDVLLYKWVKGKWVKKIKWLKNKMENW